MELIERHKTTLVFCNTRSLAELIFQDLWAVNDQALPIGIHHGSLAVEARRKVEAAMAAGKLRGLVCTASLDLGIDWGDVDLVIQMGAPKGSSRLLQRIGRANHRLDEPSEGDHRPRQPLRISRGARRARRDRRGRARSRDLPPRRARRARPAYPGRRLRRRRSTRRSCSPRSARAAPYAGLQRRDCSREVLDFIATGGYALKAYDKFRRLMPRAPTGAGGSRTRASSSSTG